MSESRCAPAVVTMTALELATLLSLRPGQAASGAARRLAIGPADSAALAAGHRSLLDRGYLGRIVDQIRPTGPAAVIAHVLSEPARWLSIVNGTPDGVSGSVLVDGPAASLVFVPRTDRTFGVLALPPGTSSNSVVGSAVLPFLDVKAPAVVVLTAATETTEASLTLSRDPAGGWWLRDGDQPARPASRNAASTAIGVLISS